MTDESIENPDEAPSTEENDEGRAILRLETRLAQAEAQIQTLQEGMADMNAFVRVSRQRALYLRIGLLAALLAAFFFLQYSK